MFRPIPAIPSGSLLPTDFQQIPQFPTKNRILTGDLRRFLKIMAHLFYHCLPSKTLGKQMGKQKGKQ